MKEKRDMERIERRVQTRIPKDYKDDFVKISKVINDAEIIPDNTESIILNEENKTIEILSKDGSVLTIDEFSGDKDTLIINTARTILISLAVDSELDITDKSLQWTPIQTHQAMLALSEPYSKMCVAEASFSVLYEM